MDETGLVIKLLYPSPAVTLEDMGCVGAAHDTQDVGEVSEGGGLAVACLPQVQDVLGGTRLARKVVQVPVVVWWGEEGGVGISINILYV